MRISRTSLRAPMVGYGWVRILPLVGAVTSVGLLHIPQVEPTWADWVLAVTAALLVLAGGVRPLTVTVAQSALLVVATASTTIGEGVTQVLTAVALGELAFRRRGRPLWIGVAVVTVATGVAYFPGYSVPANVLRTLQLVGLPLLLGSYLRSQRELAWQAGQRATEAARTEVARELHDVVAHHVAAIVLRVGVARHVTSADPRTAEVLDDVHGIASEALADLRGLVSMLRDPTAVDQPGLLAATDLTTALDAVVDRTRQAGIDLDTDIDGDAVRHLDITHRHAVLRVVQEGLTNVLKHAGTGVRARLAISRQPDDGQVEIVVRDTGGTATRTPGSPGHGLTVMRERVELLHGSLTVGATATGWRLHAALPDADEAGS